MKKKILSGLFASALLIAAATGAMESKKSEAGLSDLAMANIEALANGEGGEPMNIPRRYAEQGNYSNGTLMWRCQTCSYDFCKNISSSSNCVRY